MPLPPFPTPRLSIPEEGLRLSSFEIHDGDGWGWVWDPDDGHVELDGYVHFDEQSFDEFATFIRAQSERLAQLKGLKERKWWPALDIALRLIVKAFVSGTSLEKFLWSVVALEALLGKKADQTAGGLAKNLGQRLAILCGNMTTVTDADGQPRQQHDVCELVKDLYELVRDRVEILRPLEKQFYGDWEFEVQDPNGYVLVFSELIE